MRDSGLNMPQIFVANPKGGCGKTTISAQLAGYFADHGVSVLLKDHDAQRSSHDWLQSRPSACSKIQLQVESAVSPKLNDKLNDTLVIHDMPATWSPSDNASAISAGDYLIIPLLPSPTDIKACVRFLMGLYRCGVFELDIQIGLVANRVKTNTRYFKILETFLSRLQLPLICQLRDTQNYVRVMDTGLTIFDLPPSRAQKDLEAWDTILSWLEATKLIEQYTKDSTGNVLLSA